MIDNLIVVFNFKFLVSKQNMVKYFNWHKKIYIWLIYLAYMTKFSPLSYVNQIPLNLDA